MDFADIFAFLKARLAQGQPCVLVTVCAVEGSSMRNPGTLMGVARDGAFTGSLSGGCIENAVVAEALDALDHGAVALVSSENIDNGAFMHGRRGGSLAWDARDFLCV